MNFEFNELYHLDTVDWDVKIQNAFLTIVMVPIILAAINLFAM